MGITPQGADQINWSAFTDLKDNSTIIDGWTFVQTNAGIPFSEMAILATMIIIFVGMKSQEQDTLDSATSTLAAGAILSLYLLLMNKISDLWVVGNVIGLLICTFLLYIRARNR